MNNDFDWMSMFANMSNIDLDSVVQQYMEQMEINIINQIRANLNSNIDTLTEKIKAKQSRTTGSGTSKSTNTGYNESMDPFKILGVTQNCSEEEFKSAYRKKCMETHPDKGGDPMKFKLVQAAYEAIKRFRNWN